MRCGCVVVDVLWLWRTSILVISLAYLSSWLGRVVLISTGRGGGSGRGRQGEGGK